MNFGNLSGQWWDPDGPMRPLHDLTPIRGDYALKQMAQMPKTVLDFGCGAGILSEWFAENGIKTTGIDIEQDLINTAIRHAKLSNLEINYICADNSDKCKKVDLITCMEVLEHCSNHRELIEMFSNKLNKNGILCISTINDTWVAFLKTIVAAEYLLNLLPKGTHTREGFIKPAQIIRLAQEYNLQLVAATGLEYLPHSRTGTLVNDLSNNYILVFKKSC